MKTVDITSVYHAIHRAQCDAGIPIPWTRPEIDSEIRSLETYYIVTGDAAVAAAFGPVWSAKTTSLERDVVNVGLLMARILDDSPGHRAILQTLLAGIK